MPMLFSPTIGAAIAGGLWFLWVRCPACRTINAIDLRTLDRHRDAAVTSLIPAPSAPAFLPTMFFRLRRSIQFTRPVDNGGASREISAISKMLPLWFLSSMKKRALR